MRAVARARGLGWWRTLSTGALVGTAAILIVGLFAAAGTEQLGFDFRFQYFSGAESVAEGRSLYTTPEDPALDEVKAYVYPPQLAVALVPFTVLSADAAAVVAVLASLAALIGALAVVGVRDVRCYAAVLVSAPAWNVLETANVSAFLMLGVALAWRFRSTVWPLAFVLGLAISTKLFLWPLLIWAAVARGLRVAGVAVAVGVAVTAAAWAAIGFEGLTGYPALLERLSEIHAENSYSLVGIAAALEIEPAGRVLMLVVGGALVAACVGLGRGGDDRRAFTCAIAASFALTPIVWQHYVLLLLVPLALARPRFSAVWLLPALLWLSPRSGNGDGLEPFLPALVVVALLCFLLARPPASRVVAEAAA